MGTEITARLEPAFRNGPGNRLISFRAFVHRVYFYIVKV